MSIDHEIDNPIRRDGEDAGTGVWTPEWAVAIHGMRIGITIDDGCFVFLSVFDGEWRPLHWIPKEAIQRASEILALNGLPVKNGYDLTLADGPKLGPLVD